MISSPGGVARPRLLSGVDMSPLANSFDDSRYSVEHLRKMVAPGTIPNAGEKGRPRIRRSDLPTRPTNGKGHVGSSDDDARTFLNRANRR
jgi:hypothetical protein